MALFNELTDLLLIVNIIFGLFLTQFVNISHISVAVAISQTADVLGEIPVKTAVLYQGPQILRLESGMRLIWWFCQEEDLAQVHRSELYLVAQPLSLSHLSACPQHLLTPPQQLATLKK